MTLDAVFIPREGSTPAGKDWEAFMQHQTAVLTERARDGWDLVTATDIIVPSTINQASRTGGVMLYFRRP